MTQRGPWLVAGRLGAEEHQQAVAQPASAPTEVKEFTLTDGQQLKIDATGLADGRACLDMVDDDTVPAISSMFSISVALLFSLGVLRPSSVMISAITGCRRRSAPAQSRRRRGRRPRPA